MNAIGERYVVTNGEKYYATDSHSGGYPYAEESISGAKVFYKIEQAIDLVIQIYSSKSTFDSFMRDYSSTTPWYVARLVAEPIAGTSYRVTLAEAKELIVTDPAVADIIKGLSKNEAVALLYRLCKSKTFTRVQSNNPKLEIAWRVFRAERMQ
ncbi:hypothetical protein SEA_FORZA_39 [Gordonia phage Forza]|uniref:Uncharacterized protein n=1 Tax=Gordonia phage Forza TaxID=2571247 RepID=A0A650FAW5_9CAUD|nr:hypothetical protein PP303_gp039 [Gordonia phage Forza]QEM41509.1 hypothetical protein SEA_BOOPY_40 [Gordonia phage Boopy]QGT55032.1 hypothetical protein SEA_FORZA_39 [Gordonia phage Forza]UXE04182.1 hypothetical protein SEA_BLUENGOLD_38 [Gordonia phage BlueNGold]WBF03821.1 hypothetical protein SEA_MAREELIH_38 [Gordonia phage Mareelih]